MAWWGSPDTPALSELFVITTRPTSGYKRPLLGITPVYI